MANTCKESSLQNLKEEVSRDRTGGKFSGQRYGLYEMAATYGVDQRLVSGAQGYSAILCANSIRRCENETRAMIRNLDPEKSREIMKGGSNCARQLLPALPAGGGACPTPIDTNLSSGLRCIFGEHSSTFGHCYLSGKRRRICLPQRRKVRQ